MFRRNLIWLLVFGAGLLLVGGCKSIGHGPKFDPRNANDPFTKSLQEVAPTNAIDPTWLKPDPNEFRLGPGDRIDIEIVGGLPQPTLVGPDGKIYFHLLPGLNVWGLTLRETRDLLQRELAHYIKYPDVAVTLREVQSRRVWVLGRLARPGIYSLDTPTTVIEAITRAGGLYTSAFTGTTEELADLQHSFVLRHGQRLPINMKRLVHEGDMTQNIYLEPDDFVYLPSSLSTEVYVLGAVVLPRAIAFKDQVTLSSVIANAGGLLPAARVREVVIIRGSLTEPHYAVVNFLDILKGKAPELRLQPHDIVYVPDQPLQPLTKALNLILDTFVRTVAANEGSRAGGTSTKVGVGINVGP